MRVPRSWTIAVVLPLLTSCGGSDGGVEPRRVEPGPVATPIAMYAGNNQSAAPGASLASPLVIKVTDGTNKPVSGVAVKTNARERDAVTHNKVAVTQR